MAIHRLTASSPLIHISLQSAEHSSAAIALIDTGASITAIHPELIRILNPQTIDIIGRDLMSRWLMSWDGPADQLTISY